METEQVQEIKEEIPAKIKTPLELAWEACDVAKMALPEKAWGGKYWEWDAENKKNIEKDNPAVIKPDHPRYWAKENCKYCYGRGIEGKMTITVGSNKLHTEAMCSCARRRFERWKEVFVKEWLVGHLGDAKTEVLDT